MRFEVLGRVINDIFCPRLDPPHKTRERVEARGSSVRLVFKTKAVQIRKPYVLINDIKIDYHR